METRLKPRLQVVLTIACEICKKEEDSITLTKGNKFEIKAFDVSESGIGAFSGYFLPKDTIVDLEIAGDSFGSHENIKVKGEVRYCKYIRASGKHKYRCGIKFLNLLNGHRKTVAQFIAKYERRDSSRLSLE